MNEEIIKSQCPVCQYPVQSDYNLCPHCGKKFHEPPQPTGVGRQIVIYLISFFLPPLGLWPGMSYVRQKDKKAKTIGIVAIALTIISLGASIWFTAAFFDQYSKVLNSYQLGGY